MKNFSMMDIIMWLLVAAMVVLIITHAKDFATAVSSVGSNTNDVLGTLTAQKSATNA